MSAELFTKKNVKEHTLKESKRRKGTVKDLVYLTIYYFILYVCLHRMRRIDVNMSFIIISNSWYTYNQQNIE